MKNNNLIKQIIYVFNFYKSCVERLYIQSLELFNMTFAFRNYNHSDIHE